MKKAINGIVDVLDSAGIEYEKLNSAECEVIVERWLSVFSSNVKKKTGAWIYKGLKWHCFSWGFEDAKNGTIALQAYQSQWPTPYVIFDDGGNWCYRCESQDYPDLTVLGSDIYVAHQNMKWTIAFTHEQPQIGPFFCEYRPGP